MIDLSANLARRVRTAAGLLVNLSKNIPSAPRTVFGLVASISSGAPEAEFPADDAMLVAYLAGELEGIAVGLDVQLPVLLMAAGIERELAADEVALAHALSSRNSAALPGPRAAE